MQKIYRAFVLLLVAAAANAQDNDVDFEVTPFLGYRFGGSFSIEASSDSYEMRDSSSYGVIVNWQHSGETKWEVLYSRQNSDAEIGAGAAVDPSVDLDLQVFQLGGTYQFEGEKAQPYLAATIGGTHARASSNGSKSDTFWSGSIGVGVLFSPTTRFGLRLEARYIGTLVNSSSALFCRTGPDANLCSARIEGDVLSQVETFAGVVVRF